MVDAVDTNNQNGFLESSKVFLEELALTQALINPFLENLLASLTQSHPRLLAAASHGLLSGGKRLRAHLTLTAGKLLGVNPDFGLRVAAAIEMVHAYSLMHDDLPALDNAPMRRGQPSTHIMFDQATALLAGNALFTQAIGMLAETKTHPVAWVRLKLIQALIEAAGFKGMMAGQMMDILADHTSLEDLEKMETLKTGCLLAFALRAPLIMIAEREGESEKLDQHPLVKLGLLFGLIFQMIDDILDATGTVDLLGKETGLDQANCRHTFVSLLGIEGARQYAHSLMQQALEKLPCSLNPHRIWDKIGAFILSRAF